MREIADRYLRHLVFKLLKKAHPSRPLRMRLYLKIACLMEKRMTKPSQVKPPSQPSLYLNAKEGQSNEIKVIDVQEDSTGRAYDSITGEFLKLVDLRDGEGPVVILGVDDGDYVRMDSRGRMRPWYPPEGSGVEN